METVEKERIGLLAASLFATFSVLVLGCVVIAPALNIWYAELLKPVFNPPNWVFAPVWIVLYAAMASAAYLVLLEGWKKASVRKAIAAYGVQLILNLTWIVVFFGLQQTWAALFVIALLWIAIIVNKFYFWRVRSLAGWLLVPYLLWVTFAAVLNGSIAGLN